MNQETSAGPGAAQRWRLCRAEGELCKSWWKQSHSRGHTEQRQTSVCVCVYASACARSLYKAVRQRGVPDLYFCQSPFFPLHSSVPSSHPCCCCHLLFSTIFFSSILLFISSIVFSFLLLRTSSCTHPILLFVCRSSTDAKQIVCHHPCIMRSV